MRSYIANGRSGELLLITSETLDIGEQDADVLVAMDVYSVELIRRE